MGVLVPRVFRVICVCVVIFLTVAGGNGDTVEDPKLSDLLQELREMKEEAMEKLEVLKNDTDEIKTLLKNPHGNVSAGILARCQTALQQDIVELRNQLEQIANNLSRPTNCREIVPAHKQGVFRIWIRGWNQSRYVYCDDDWTVIQKRQDGSVDFYRVWEDYKAGFGNATGEYWLGMKTIREMTKEGDWQLQIDLGDWENNTAHALYSRFSVGSESDHYRLSNLKYMKSPAGDSLNKYHKKKPFSTYDKDHDMWSKNCATQYRGAWWYSSCLASNLNGQYKHKKQSSSDGITWKTWKGFNYSLKTAVMKIKPV